MILLAILLPWLSLLIRGEFLAGIICLILQCTLIGWLPAMIWAIISYNNEKTDKRFKQFQQPTLINRSINVRNTIPNAPKESHNYDIFIKIENLVKLKDQGLITEEEFEEHKKRMLTLPNQLPN